MAMLVYYSLQSTVLNGRKAVHSRYEEMQAINRPPFAYYNADNCLSNLW